MSSTPRSRDAFRLAVNVATGIIVSGSIAATGALAAVAANETAAKEHRKGSADLASPVVVVKQRPTKVVPRYVTKPAKGGTITSPRVARRTVVVTRVVRTTKSSGS